VVVGLAKGTVTVPPPELRESVRLPASWAFAGAGLLVLATAGVCALLWNRLGRDRKFAAVPLGLAPAPGQQAAEEFVSITGEPQPAVSFVPPRGVRPALAGLLVAERVRPLHVSATIVDLAVRGYLRIEELAAANSSGRDWRLSWRGQPPPGDQLAPFEQLLVDRLFDGQPAVQLSQLRGTFAPKVRQVSRQLADEGLRAGWFRRRPRVAGERSGWVAGCVLVVVLVPFLGFGTFASLFVLGWPVLILAAGVLVSAIIAAITIKAMPARTALGRAVWAQVMGFRRYLETAEAGQLRDDEAADRFTRYLPYALIFGLTGRWAAVLGELQRPVDTDWYIGPAQGNLLWMGAAMTDFSSTSSSSLSYTPSSSAGGSSGFSGGSVGGGSGGGGGGSW
jgi:uncharacterized protein (TIGR04222 family)